MKPIAFKVRGGGNYSGTKGGTVRPNEKGGTGALWYIDKTFTIASTQDQFIATPITNERTQDQSMTTQPNNAPQVPLRFLSVCSGMEAASVAWEPLGWKAVGFSEIEPFPCAILKHRFPNTPNYGSLTEYQSWPLGPDSIDLLVGGTPCQSFSVAGLRKGLADPRGNLALTFLGLADKLRPRWIVWENVPGVLSSGGGRDFGSFLGALEQLGYGWAYRVLDAQYFGVPQRRRRVFVVASLGGRDVAASVLLKPESLCWHPAKGRKKGQATAPDAGSGVEASGCWWDGGQVSQTLDAVLAKGQTMPEKNRFPAVLQPVPIAFKVRGGGNYFGTKGGEVKPDEKGGTGYLGYEDKTFTVATAQDQWVAAPVTQADVAGPLDAHYYKGPGSRQGGEREYVAHPPAMAVRRLTCVETERLQGFPDNWSRIPWKGKPEYQCPDGPRYKACGNSMAVPCMRWIGEQIARVELSHNPTNQTNA